jgi:16S rRNA (guanine527-N7)-methyltransferase
MSEPAGSRLGDLLRAAGLGNLNPNDAARFSDYLDLVERWNRRINLTSIRDRGEILQRHFVESIACARFLPAGIATLLDFGSGAGLPGVPIAIYRPEIAVTLAESQGKKAAFLREVVRVLGLTATVHAGRAETLSGRFDCVAMRAVDRMEEAVPIASRLVAPGGWLALFTTEEERDDLKTAAGPGFHWERETRLPLSATRILILGAREA